ncbi:hypothetical protein TL16_g08612 [Triparma laevis f. inornata]|uniref:ENTH domain-containing protein n=1 Tax=Triparma laevis f. inornata TaxID=1714386 RepID=A0A9W7B320_9STRA|nr:hypothetical protein TL16_g08612 [Triparma laevis f. inornata]
MRLTLPLIMIVALFSATPGLAKSRGNRAPPASQRRPSGRPRDVARAAPRPAAGRGAKRKQSAGYDDESDGSAPGRGAPRRGALPSRSGGGDGRAQQRGSGGRAQQRRGSAPQRGRGGRAPPRRQQQQSQIGPYVGKAASQASAFATRGIAALRSSVPEIKAKAEASMEAVQGVGGKYIREVKGMMSSELEQVLLKSTRPDDTAVKPKHVERLVGVTYQISGQYDLYDPILRKLWAKMAELDWRTTTKALYVLHRFSADGSPDHAAALKARLRELRRTRDQKRKEKYFNSKLLLTVSSPDGSDITPYKAFLSRYAHYVLLRAQCFGGAFGEISGGGSRRSRSGAASITSGGLRPEHLEAAKMILAAGSKCALKKGEDCDITASCLERVVTDLKSLTSAVGKSLTLSLKSPSTLSTSDKKLISQWCVFYEEELCVKAREIFKESQGTLDRYGLFVQGRVGGAKGGEEEGGEEEEEEEEKEEVEEEEEQEKEEEVEKEPAEEEQEEDGEGGGGEEDDDDEEYEYDDEEY